MHEPYLAEQLENLTRIERLCQQFARSLEEQSTADIPAEIHRVCGRMCKRTFAHMLHIELGRRLYLGEAPTAAEYTARYPSFSAYVRLVFGDPSVPRLLPPIDLQIISHGARRRYLVFRGNRRRQ